MPWRRGIDLSSLPFLLLVFCTAALSSKEVCTSPSCASKPRPGSTAFTSPLSDIATASMGLLDAIKGAMGGGSRTYDDLKPGSFAAETAKYAMADEIKTHSEDGLEIATFGGGCFWGVELSYQRVPGVVETCVGYTQGPVPHPTYNAVCSGSTGHTEAVQLKFDPKAVSMEDLTALLFSRINPALKNQVGNDRGTQYRHGVYYHSDAQKSAAEKIFEQVKAKGGTVYTELEPAKVFYPAEGYHQQYLEKGGRGGNAQSASKGCKDPIRCYG